MFLADSGTELEGGRLRSGRIFRSEKRRKIVTRRGSSSMTRGDDYDLESHLDECSCNEKEEYHLISDREEEEEV